MVATRLLFDDSNPSGYVIPFNRTFFVRAVTPPRNPLEDDATVHQRIVYAMLERGLVIEEIRPLDQEGFVE